MTKRIEMPPQPIKAEGNTPVKKLPRGNPTVYTQQNVDFITELIARGHTRKTAAGKAGITLEKFEFWLKNKGPFRRAIRAAEAMAKERVEAALMRSIEKYQYFPAIKYWLENRYSEAWKASPDTAVQNNLAIVLQAPDGKKIAEI